MSGSVLQKTTFAGYRRRFRTLSRYALFLAQTGKKHPNAKPLKGFGGAAALEIVEDYRSGTYRAVYTVRFEEAVYVLHVFQKKATHGIATPKHELDLIEQRLKRAVEFHSTWKKS